MINIEDTQLPNAKHQINICKSDVEKDDFARKLNEKIKQVEVEVISSINEETKLNNSNSINNNSNEIESEGTRSATAPSNVSSPNSLIINEEDDDDHDSSSSSGLASSASPHSSSSQHSPNSSASSTSQSISSSSSITHSIGCSPEKQPHEDDSKEQTMIGEVRDEKNMNEDKETSIKQIICDDRVHEIKTGDCNDSKNSPIDIIPMPEPTVANDKYESMQPRLKKFLKIYQLSARNSVNGPSQNDMEMCNHANSNVEKSSDQQQNSPPTPSQTPSSISNSDHSPEQQQHTSETGMDQENNNLSIIATVAAAAAAAASSKSDLNKDRLDNSNGQTTQSFNNHHSGSGRSSDGSSHHRDRDRDRHHHHHHHHHHKRAKYFSSLTPSNSNGASSNRASSLGGSRDSSSQKTNQSNSSNNSFLKCIQADTDTSPLMETSLHGERISCFIVGGERRLCLHDILNTILRDFSVQQINSACQKLQIACLESSPKQLEILKKLHLLPAGAPNCGLLTQTNSERLCAYLMDSVLSAPGPPPPVSSPDGNNSSNSNKKASIKIFHECFGRTYGHLYLHMYSKSDSPCVECDTCRKMYTPKNFVCHSHKYESYTRHWGFDSANWRSYLHLVNNQSNQAQTATNGNANRILGDLRISNKDNIAANTKQNSSAQEEFELFKQKFSNSSSGNNQGNSLLNGSSNNIPIVGAFKRKSIYENDIIQNLKLTGENHLFQHSIPTHQLPPNKRMHLAHNNEINTPLKPQAQQASAAVAAAAANLLLLNEQMSSKPSALSPSSKSGLNGISSSSASEHKLLNGLLSRPLNTANSTSEHSNRFFLNDDFIINSNGQKQQSNNNQQIPTPTSTPTPQTPTPTPASSLYYSLLNNANNQQLNGKLGSSVSSSKSLLLPTSAELNSSGKMGNLGMAYAAAAAAAAYNGNNNGNNNIELNMLELILNEVDMLNMSLSNSQIDLKESNIGAALSATADRLRQMITKMHLYYMEKLNNQQIVQNKLLAEFDEFKMSIQNENDQLRCQLKLLQLQNELINNNSNKEMNVNGNSLSSSNGSFSSFKKTTSTAPMQASPLGGIKTNSNNNNSAAAAAQLAANQHLQNILLFQHHQQQQQQQQQKNAELQQHQQQAAVAAFPQFFLSHYNNGSHSQNPLSSSTPKKPTNSSSSLNTPNSSFSQQSANSKPSNTISSLLASQQQQQLHHHLLQQHGHNQHHFGSGSQQHHNNILHQFNSNAAAAAAASAANNLALLSAAASKCESNSIQQSQQQQQTAGVN